MVWSPFATPNFASMTSQRNAAAASASQPINPARTLTAAAAAPAQGYHSFSSSSIHLSFQSYGYNSYQSKLTSQN